MLNKSASFLFIIGFSVLTGCSDISQSPGPIGDPNVTEPNTSQSVNYPKVTIIYNHPQDGITQESGSPMVTTLIDTWFNKIDWKNSNQSMIQIEQDEDHSLSIRGTSKASEETVKYFAQWKHPPKEPNKLVNIVIQQSESFKDAAKAKELLKLFLEKDPSFESSIKWTSSGSGKR